MSNGPTENLIRVICSHVGWLLKHIVPSHKYEKIGCKGKKCIFEHFMGYVFVSEQPDESVGEIELWSVDFPQGGFLVLAEER